MEEVSATIRVEWMATSCSMEEEKIMEEEGPLHSGSPSGFRQCSSAPGPRHQLAPRPAKEEQDAAGSSSWSSSSTVSLPVDVWPAEVASWRKKSIAWVPEWVKRATSADAYRPSMVSLGPFHNGDAGLLPMEEHKSRAVRHFVERSGKPLETFVSAIDEVADELQEAYDGLADAWRGVANRGRFVELMVTDGCFLLEFMRAGKIIRTKEDVDEDYAANDPIFSDTSFHYVRSMVRADLITMENQLPLLVLQRLLAVQRGEEVSAQLINKWVMSLLRCPVEESMNNLALHPLDIFHRSICGPPRPEIEASRSADDISMPSAVQLRKAGIQFKKRKKHWIRGVDFSNGVLFMPLVKVGDETEKVYLNLMAFEWLYREVGNHVTDFVLFMDNLIDTEQDVALLKSMGVLEQVLGSDRQVAMLFNRIHKGAVMSPSSKLCDVHRKVKAYHGSRWNRWCASFRQAHLRNPWVFMSLVAAVILLALTFLQTVYTVCKKC